MEKGFLEYRFFTINNFEAVLMSILRTSFLTGVICLSLLSCDDKKGDDESGNGNGGGGGSSGGAEYSSVYVGLKAKQSVALAPTNCHVQDSPNGKSADGLCFTPDNIEVWANSVYLTKPNSGSTGGARLLGGGSGLGKDGYLEGALFDLNKLGQLRGYDTLWEDYDNKTSWSMLHIGIAYIRVYFTVKNEKWEMLIPYLPQPLENEEWVKACYDAPYIANMKDRANPLTGITAARGDYLFCKSENNEKCAFTDFKWFDKTTKTLMATRPSNPRNFAYLATNAGSECKAASSNGGPPEVVDTSIPLFVNLSQPLFKLYADYSHGSDSKTNPGGSRPSAVTEAEWQAHKDAGQPTSPHFVYFYEKDGITESGNRMDVTFTFDTSNYLVADTIYSFDSASIEDILAVITTKDIFLRENTPKGEEFNPQMSADVSAKASQVSLDKVYSTAEPGQTVTEVAE